ncbi:MAG: exodeoxyribonuclease VII small subunit [Acidobacteriota bacterium]
MEVKDFEQALGRLEAIVSELEKGELALERALQLFEEGVNISRFCSSKLDAAERRVDILMKDDRGQLVEQPFEVESETEKDA